MKQGAARQHDALAKLPPLQGKGKEKTETSVLQKPRRNTNTVLNEAVVASIPAEPHLTVAREHVPDKRVAAHNTTIEKRHPHPALS